MIQSIKKQIKLSLGDCGIGLGVTAGCVVFGLIFTQMMRVAGPVEPAEMALFTSVFGALGAGIYIALYMGFSLLINFKLQVGMGSTRKDFLVSSYIVGAVSSLVLVFFVAAASAVSQAAYSRIYGTKDILDVTPMVLKWGIPAAFSLPAVSSMCGALILRFGKRAGWIIWAIWMIGCLGFPWMAETVSGMPDSEIGKVGTSAVSMLRNIPDGMWIVLILIAGAIGFAVEAHLLSGQEV